MTEQEITICGHGSGFPSLKNMYQYLQSRYEQKASNGVRKGLVAVRRMKGLTENERKKFVATYKSILGRNYYSQTLREYVLRPYTDGRYYSDCSSSGDACYAAAGHDVGWLNTAGMYTSKKFEDVPVKIVEGHVANPEVLKEGDALLFAGNDPSRPKQIGHVEYVYAMPIQGWHWGHVGDEWFYQDGDGRNSYGWKLIKETNGDASHWYFFDMRGVMQTGVLHINGATYYLMESGPLEGACCKTNDAGALEVWNL